MSELVLLLSSMLGNAETMMRNRDGKIMYFLIFKMEFWLC